LQLRNGLKNGGVWDVTPFFIFTAVDNLKSYEERPLVRCTRELPKFGRGD
jgi:hypothetical protein